MSAPQAIVIDSDDEPQPKKPKQDRSPLVVINGDVVTKRKQLTLKDLVSPKSKQSTLSNFKVLSPKVTSKTTGKQPLKTSPKENVEPAANPSAAATDTTPVRGVKRKSTCEEGESEKTPVKQMKVPETVRDIVEESPKSAKITKTPVPKPTLASMLKRSPKQQNSDKSGNQPDAKLDDKKDAKPKEVTDETNAVLELKPVKKKFGDYKKKDSVHMKCVKEKTTDKSVDFSSPAMKEQPAPKDKPVTQTAASKSAEPISVEEDADVTEESEAMETVTAGDEDDAKNSSDSDKAQSPKIHLDSEKPGPSGIKGAAAKKPRPLTEKQKKLQEEREKKKREIAEEKERKRLEREKEKEVREEAKRVEQAKKDAEKQNREKAREEARLKKEEEKKLKEEERKLKEEERKQKDAEKEIERKRKLQENEERENEKRVKEEEQEKKRQKQIKEQQKFKSFFVVKKPTVVSTLPKVETLEKKFREFVITPTMSVAPLTRTAPVTRDILSSNTVSWDKSVQHIRDVISEMRCKNKYETEQLSCDLEIISISSPKQVKVKRKILHFYENHRPAYCGSWRKKSSFIGPRRPFGQDKTLLEYDYDSDEDWEEEEEGEDITSEKEDEKEEEKENANEDDDDDDGFFVPHGYLSDDEGDEDCGMTEEAKKKRVERRRKQFEEEQKSKENGILKAKIVGPAWQADISGTPSDSARFLAQFKAVWSSDLSEEPLDPFARTQPVAQMETNDSTVKYVNDKRALPEAGYGMLIRFLHGSPIGMSRAVETFQEMWHSDKTRGKVSKRQLNQLIPTLMKKCVRPGNGMKLCWYTSDEVLLKYELTDLVGLHCEVPEPLIPQPPPKPANSLLKFTKTSSAEQDLAMLRQQQSLQQALQQAVKLQQEALLQQQQQQQQQQAKLEPPQNTLKNFLTTSAVKQTPPVSVTGNIGNGTVTPPSSAAILGVTPSSAPSLGLQKLLPSVQSSVGNATVIPPNSAPSLGVQKPLPSVQNMTGAPRRISLVPIKLVQSSTPIDIDDSN